MPEINLDLDPDLHARLTQWAQEQRRPLSALASDILAAAERVLANYDPEMSQSTRWIRMCRDGGCRLCDELEPLFAMGITKAPSYDRYGAIAKRIAPPFIQSRASWPLTATTVSIMAFGMWLPYSPLAPALGLAHLPPLYWPILALTLFGYVVLTQLIKVRLLRQKWI